jgi:NAD(P)-dependent dehydrogenase (short-subunit alcohol dehydrogenase family)
LYSASKGAVRALTLAMAADFVKDGIRVNCVSPGTVDSPWIAPRLNASPNPERIRASLEARQPNGRLVTTQEIADGIAFLASPHARSTTGTDLNIDGGFSRLRLSADPPTTDRADIALGTSPRAP